MTHEAFTATNVSICSALALHHDEGQSVVNSLHTWHGPQHVLDLLKDALLVLPIKSNRKMVLHATKALGGAVDMPLPAVRD